MKHAIFSVLLICCLSWGCGNSEDKSGRSSNIAGSDDVPSAGSAGTSDQPHSGGGNASGGHSSSGGSHSGGGSTSGGSASGGQSSANAGAGGKTQWPTWVGQCQQLRAAKCGDCNTPDCVVCIYGKDEELASTGANCDEPLRNYKEYCSCNLSGCPLPCRPEYQ
ncbi:MAG TPA: hypothetical protein VER96_06005 [Polyangiaceae bacterium]|nr:hypothetical protein [Polyangiaceae bacterium]